MTLVLSGDGGDHRRFIPLAGAPLPGQLVQDGQQPEIARLDGAVEIIGQGPGQIGGGDFGDPMSLGPALQDGPADQHHDGQGDEAAPQQQGSQIGVAADRPGACTAWRGRSR